MDINSFFKRNWVHFAAIALFLIIGMAYFSQQLKGYGLKQHDIEQYTGSSHETSDFREKNDGQEPLWTNSMFGGMPTTQISMIYSGNLIQRFIMTPFLKTFPAPMGIVLLYMICAYIGLVMMRVNKWISIIGAVAFAFLSYDIIILQAGHNTKGLAIAFMLPVVGAFIMAYRRNWLLGAALGGLFMALELSSNHLQVTYYLAFLLVGLGLVEFIRAIRTKNFMPFIKASSGVIAGYLLAVMVNYGNISLTTDYAAKSIRGANDLTVGADGKSNTANSTSGLNRDYVTEYSYGIGESFTLLSPYIKGGGMVVLADSPFADKADQLSADSKTIDQVMGYPVYWGEQPATSGPVYLGVILVFLALLGMIYIKDPIKYALLGVSILTLALSWGKNYMGLTNFFLDHVPGYNKFRAVTIILVMVELCIPLIAILFLDKLVKERESIKNNIKPLYYATGIFVLFLFILKFAGIDTTFRTQFDVMQRERQEAGIREQIAGMDAATLQAQVGLDKSNVMQVNQFVEQNMAAFDDVQTNMVEVRKSIFQSSMTRSIVFTILGAICVFLIVSTSLPLAAGVGALGLLIVVDTMSVTRNYLDNTEQGMGYKYWETAMNTRYPITPEPGDIQIMEQEMAASAEVRDEVEKGRKEGKEKAMELDAAGSEARRIEDAYAFAALNRSTDYRVFDFSGGFSSARASYMHKSLGGYHGAKLRSIQNLYDFHLSRSNNKVYNMLNVKYFLQPTDKGIVAQPNPEAMGNGWLVRSVEVAQTPNEEILALGSRFDMKNIGDGTFVVNGEVKKEATAYGSERLQYVRSETKDTVNIPLSNGVGEGTEVLFVQDAKGTTNLIPKQTDVADTANSFKKMMEFKVVNEFKPTLEAIVGKEDAKKLSQKSYKGEGLVRLTKYAPNKLNYTVNASDKALAVFSEIYYEDGWVATIDGKPATIVRVDYLLRGLEIPKGNHKVEFRFDMPKFHSLNTWSLIASILLLLTVFGAIYVAVKNKSSHGEIIDSND